MAWSSAAAEARRQEICRALGLAPGASREDVLARLAQEEDACAAALRSESLDERRAAGFRMGELMALREDAEEVWAPEKLRPPATAPLLAPLPPAEPAPLPPAEPAPLPSAEPAPLPPAEPAPLLPDLEPPPATPPQVGRSHRPLSELVRTGRGPVAPSYGQQPASSDRSGLRPASGLLWALLVVVLAAGAFLGGLYLLQPGRLALEAPASVPAGEAFKVEVLVYSRLGRPMAGVAPALTVAGAATRTADTNFVASDQPGVAEVTARLGGLTARATIRVEGAPQPPSVARLVIRGPASLTAGSRAEFTAVGMDGAGQEVAVDRFVTWSVDGVDRREHPLVLTPERPGTLEVRARVGSAAATFAVNVAAAGGGAAPAAGTGGSQAGGTAGSGAAGGGAAPQPPPCTGAVTRVAVSAPPTIRAGQKAQLSATAYTDCGGPAPGTPVTWVVLGGDPTTTGFVDGADYYHAPTRPLTVQIRAVVGGVTQTVSIEVTR